MTRRRVLVASVVASAGLAVGCGGRAARERPAAGPARTAPTRGAESVAGGGPIREFFVPGAGGRGDTVGADAAVGAADRGGVRLPTVVEAECGDFPSQGAAQSALRARPVGPHRLDEDGSGVACEGLPEPFDRAPVPR